MPLRFPSIWMVVVKWSTSPHPPPQIKFHRTFLGTIKSYLWQMIYLLQEDWYVTSKEKIHRLVWFVVFVLRKLYEIYFYI